MLSFWVINCNYIPEGWAQAQPPCQRHFGNPKAPRCSRGEGLVASGYQKCGGEGHPGA